MSDARDGPRPAQQNVVDLEFDVLDPRGVAVAARAVDEPGESRVGLVVIHPPAARAECGPEAVGESAVAVVEHADVELPHDPAHDRREAVQGEQPRPQPAALEARDRPLDRAVIGRMEVVDATAALRARHPSVAGNRDPVARREDQTRVGRVAVAVDEQPGPARGDASRTEFAADRLLQRVRAEVPADVVAQRRPPEPERSVLPRHGATRVLAGENPGPAAGHGRGRTAHAARFLSRKLSSLRQESCAAASWKEGRSSQKKPWSAPG